VIVASGYLDEPDIFWWSDSGKKEYSSSCIQVFPGFSPEPFFFRKASVVSLIRRSIQRSSNSEGYTNFTWFETSQSSHCRRSATRAKRGVPGGEWYGEPGFVERERQDKGKGLFNRLNRFFGVPDHKNTGSADACPGKKMYCPDSLLNRYPLVHEPEGFVASRFKTRIDPYAPCTLHEVNEFGGEPVDP
jgi:hypothetical protein